MSSLIYTPEVGVPTFSSMPKDTECQWRKLSRIFHILNLHRRGNTKLVTSIARQEYGGGSLVSLPNEILAEIFAGLPSPFSGSTGQDLRLVNRRFNEIASAFVFRVLALHGPWSRARVDLKFLSDGDLARHAREVWVQDNLLADAGDDLESGIELLERVLQTCLPVMNSIWWNEHYRYLSQRFEREKTLFEMFGRAFAEIDCTRLVYAHIEPCSVSNLNRMVELSEGKVSFPSLERLVIEARCVSEEDLALNFMCFGSVLEFFPRGNTGLRIVHIEAFPLNYTMQPPLIESDWLSLGDHVNLVNLRECTIACFLALRDTTTLLRFLDRTPNLKKLSLSQIFLDAIPPDPAPNWADVFRLCAENLSSLTEYSFRCLRNLGKPADFGRPSTDKEAQDQFDADTKTAASARKFSTWFAEEVTALEELRSTVKAKRERMGLPLCVY